MIVGYRSHTSQEFREFVILDLSILESADVNDVFSFIEDSIPVVERFF